MKLYVVRNKEGKYFRNIGYGGHGKSWRDKLEDAKFYTKIGQAKSRVTFFFREYPQFGCPEILEWDLEVNTAKVLNMEEITTKSIEKIKKKKLEEKIASQQREKKYKEDQIKKLQDDLRRLTK